MAKSRGGLPSDRLNMVSVAMTRRKYFPSGKPRCLKEAIGVTKQGTELFDGRF
jgi:hypothetical protein